MIWDQENLYFDGAAAITSGSNVIVNQGGGDAYDTLFLAVESTTKETAELTFELQTAADSAFTEPKTLATFKSKVDAKGLILSAKMPHGMLEYSRLVGTGTPVGKITAGLVVDVPMGHE